MGRILKRRRRTIQGGNFNLPIDLLINTHIHTHTHIKKNQRVKNVETFNLKYSTDFASLYQEGEYSISRLFSS